jgi:hypothetical protein
MTNKSICTALTLGFLAFTVSTLVATTAEAVCVEVPAARCGPGTVQQGAVHYLGSSQPYVTCCHAPSTPSKPYATGETESQQQQRFARECEAQGKLWQGGQCINRPVKDMGKRETSKPAAIVKGQCEANGPGYKYDPQTGSCELKRMTKAKPQGAPEQAEEKSSSEQSSDKDDGYKHKKKHKKRHYDD